MQVLKLEQERRREELGRGHAKEMEELKKLLGDALRRKDIEINHLKSQVRGC
jgi:hypothetical protein